jgi:hypothetical protein
MQILVAKMPPKRPSKIPSPAEFLKVFEEIYQIGKVLQRQYDQRQPLDFGSYDQFDKRYRKALKGSFHKAAFGN